MIKYILFFLSFITFCPLSAQKHKADSLYLIQHYKDAIQIYEELLEEGVHEDVYYNLANCYYRMNRIPQAVLNYERALKLNPEHVDARHNLELCRSQVGLYEDVADDFFFVTLIKRCIASKNANQWMGYAIAAFSLMAVAWLAYCLFTTVKWRKIAFSFAAFAFVLVLILNIFAAKAVDLYTSTNRIVVLKPVETYEAPHVNSKSLGKLVAGATYFIDAEQDGEWIRVKFSDGTVAWCQNEHVAII